MAGGGTTASGFGGFGRGLANALLMNRDRQDQKRREDQAKRDREFTTMMPMHWQLFQETGDPTGLENFVGQYQPDVAKGWKKAGSPFGALAPLLSADQQAMQSEQDSAIAAGSGEQPVLPSRQPVQPVAPRKTLFGVELPTDDERLAKVSKEKSSLVTAEYQGQMDAAQRLSRVADIPLAEAMDRLGLRSTTSTGTAPQAGSIAAQVSQKNAERAAAGQPSMSQLETQQFVESIQRGTASAQREYGQDREAISLAMTGKSFGENSRETQAAIIEQEQKQLQAEGTQRRLGTGIGAFQSPMTAEQAQGVGAPVGTTSEQLAGQAVPTTPERDRRRSMEVVIGDIQRIQALLEILPSEKELAGVAPNAVLFARGRMNSPSTVVDPATGQPMSYRAAVAQLQANVEAVVNVMARTRGEQRGTQTEADAERAYNSLLQLKTSLLDPFAGDTRESAATRLSEAIAGIERVKASLPNLPTPNPNVPARGGATAAPTSPPVAGRGAGPAGAPAPAAAPGGITMKDGKLYQNGALLPGQ